MMTPEPHRDVTHRPERRDREQQTGGHVALHSEPGRGTTFRIFLPVATDVAPDARDEPQEAPAVPAGETSSWWRMRARAAGMSTSVMVLVGLAGRERSLEHARRSAEAVSRMQPTFTALLTYTPVPGSPLAERVARGELELPDALESLEEVREFVRHLDADTHLSCSHASNWLPLQGRMPSARAALLRALDAALAGRARLRPASLRGL